jgi:hypothetical protein
MRVLGYISIGLALVAAQPAWSQSKESANAIVPYCRTVIDFSDNAGRPDPNFQELLLGGQCMGTVSAMLIAGSMLKPEFRYCPADGANIGQGLRVVNQFADNNPNLLNLDFRIFVMLAFSKAWRCS